MSGDKWCIDGKGGPKSFQNKKHCQLCILMIFCSMSKQMDLYVSIHHSVNLCVSIQSPAGMDQLSEQTKSLLQNKTIYFKHF